MSSKFHLSKWKIYFSQFIDKFLKIEAVEYLIHYVKFKMWSVLFDVSSPVFPTFLDVGVRLYIIFPNLHRDWKLRFWMLLYIELSNYSQLMKKQKNWIFLD